MCFGIAVNRLVIEIFGLDFQQVGDAHYHVLLSMNVSKTENKSWVEF